MEARNHPCYCCSRYQGLQRDIMPMNLDSALNELGMLSSVTESRKQYLSERNRNHNRSKSEQGTSSSQLPDTGDNAMSSTGSESSNSLSKGYQIVKINPQYVTSLNSGNRPMKIEQIGSKKDPGHSICHGRKFMPDSLESEARGSRLTRVKFSRIKRFKKPYDVPWRFSFDYANLTSPDMGEGLNSSSPTSTNARESPSLSSIHASPTKFAVRSTSNSNTPEKKQNGRDRGSLVRSRSLDDLDLSKLNLMDKQYNVQESKEIEKMSQNFLNLHVD
ncbi:unnamed protein product [Owenia fusiformis]|uniref:Uncharacterized protein n=1 Tax=Owenia fusiformis TaxID=6347 RepID=A0A8J1Y0J2_OWEFU|nr:unnamed protein product [Owenia fusiformis]